MGHSLPGSHVGARLSLPYQCLGKIQRPLGKLLAAPIPSSPQMTHPPIDSMRQRNHAATFSFRSPPLIQIRDHFTPTGRCISVSHGREPLCRCKPFCPSPRGQRVTTRNTAPRIIQNTPAFSHPHQTGPNRIQVDIIPECRVAVRFASLHQNRFIPVTKKPSPFPVPHVESPGHRVLDPFHSLHQIGFRSLDKQMIVVAHQDPRLHPPPCFFARFGQTLQKKLPVILIQKNGLAPVPPRHHMVIRPRIFNAYTPRHDRFLNPFHV